MNRNHWPEWIGIGGRHESESLAAFSRNMQLDVDALYIGVIW